MYNIITISRDGRLCRLYKNDRLVEVPDRQAGYDLMEEAMACNPAPKLMFLINSATDYSLFRTKLANVGIY